MKHTLICTLLSLSLTSCNIGDRLDRVGRSPDFKDVKTYEDEIYDTYHQKGLTDPITDSESEKVAYKTANSLWKPGSRTFFRDQRARAVGDILKVVVTIQDNAKFDNKTEPFNEGKESSGLPVIVNPESK